jgi:Smg protein
MFEVLMFLFENYMKGSVALNVDSHTVTCELQKAGFDRHDIGRALSWLDGLIGIQEAITITEGSATASIRYYLPEECECINVECRGYLLYLERAGILDAVTREVVIDRLMALELAEVDLKRVRWVALMALFNQPSKKQALELLQEMVLADAFNMLH